jgi:hypothetical protein
MKRIALLLCLMFCLGVLTDRIVMHLWSGNHSPTVVATAGVDRIDSPPAVYVAKSESGIEGRLTLAAHGAASPSPGEASSVPGEVSSSPAAAAPAAPKQPSPAAPTPVAPAAASPVQGNSQLALSRLALTAKADLSQVTFTYHMTPVAGNADVGIQIFANREDVKSESKWEGIFPLDSAGKPLIIQLYEGLDNTGSFTVTLPKGVYGATRLILFAAPNKNVDLSKTLYDTKNDANAHLDLHLTVASAEKRVTAPILVMSPKTETADEGNGAYTATFTGVVKTPQDYHPQENGFYVMAKSPAGFAQNWVSMKNAEPSGDPADNYLKIPVQFTVKGVKAGLWNMQFGLFKYTWGDALHWVYPGVDFAVGDWVQRAPADHIPPRLRLRNNRFETLDGKPYDFYAGKPAAVEAVSFVRGGNYGNAIGWTILPEYNRPGYFALLKQMGCHFMRIAFNPERFMDEPVYRQAVDQIVQNIWAAGLYPVIGPQGLMKAATLQEQVDKSVKLVELMTRQYKGKSVWLEVCNEPYEVAEWAKWKPIVTRMVRTARAIDPDAFLIAPLEGWGKDGRAAAKDPIRDVHVDMYDAHAYIQPEDVARVYGDDVKAGLPLYIGEYGGNDATYLSRMDMALQNLHGLVAAAPWAFTKSGQDGLPLIADGSSTTLKYTQAGQQIATDYALWDEGRRKPQ